MIVGRFGLHWAAGVPFLVQSNNVQNLISPDLGSPFTVEVSPRGARCPHAIDLAVAERASWIQDPLAQAFLPLPRGDRRPQLILDRKGELGPLLMQLCRLLTPVGDVLRPIWWKDAYKYTPTYGMTNLGPIVLLGGDASRGRDIYRHLELGQSHNRHVLIIMRERVPVLDGEWITTELADVGAEPLEGIGAGALKEYMSNAEPPQ